MDVEDKDSFFRINKAYAESYDQWRRKEELAKLTSKYGADSGLDGGSDSSSESEDADALAISEETEKDWLRTLAALKTKDPKIYQKDVKFFHVSSDSVESDDESSKESDGDPSDDEDAEKRISSIDKPLYPKDYQRNLILQKGGVLSSASEDDKVIAEGNIDNAAQTRYKPQPGYYEEQDQIRKDLIETAAVVTDDSSDTDLFTKKTKTREDEDVEEKDYQAWLAGELSKSKQKEFGKDLEALRSFWRNPDLDEGQKFLRDYILNRQYKSKTPGVPCYEDIIADEEKGFSEDENSLDKQEEFEHKYNFRFQEPDKEFIKHYPRKVEESLRRRDTKRLNKRLEIRDRKAKEKMKRMEELKQLKNLKKQEISKKIDHLKTITGNLELGFSEKDLDNDFDPVKHDRLMQEIFNVDYYNQVIDDKKPVYDEEADVTEFHDEDWDNWQYDQPANYNETEDDSQQEQDGGPNVDDPGFNMDADYNPNAVIAHGKGKQKKMKGKKHNLTAALLKQKPLFNPENSSFDEYFSEYYNMDYEDIIDDMPCRFRYRTVAPCDFGLTTSEILQCPDRELNQWYSLKKTLQYRSKEEENADQIKCSTKARNRHKKMNILTTLKENEEAKQNRTEKDASVMQKVIIVDKSYTEPSTSGIIRKTMNIRDRSTAAKTIHPVDQTKRKLSKRHGPDKIIKKGKDQRRKRKCDDKRLTISDERLKAYGINPKKVKYMKRDQLKK